MRTFSRVLWAALFACAVIAPSTAPANAAGLPGGVAQTLASAVAASTNQVFTSTAIGRARAMTLCLSASGATTFTITGSTDGVLFESVALNNSASAADVTFGGAGTLCEAITPVSIIKVKTSAAVTVSVTMQAI